MTRNTLISIAAVVLMLDYSPMGMVWFDGWWAWHISTTLITCGYLLVCYLLLKTWAIIEGIKGPMPLVRFMVFLLFANKAVQILKQIISGIHKLAGGSGELSEHLTSIEMVWFGLTLIFAWWAMKTTKAGNLKIYTKGQISERQPAGFVNTNNKE